MRSEVAAGIVTTILDTAERRYGLDAKALLTAAGLRAEDVSDPSLLVPIGAFEHLLRSVMIQCGDDAFGIRWAEDFDLRSQGFWGYALLSSMTLRERLERNIRYQPLRLPADMQLRVEDGMVMIDAEVDHLASDIGNMILEMTCASGMYRLRHLLPKLGEVTVCHFKQRERPHHRELRALGNGTTIIFNAPYNRTTFPASMLDEQLKIGDPYMSKLASAQMDAALEQKSSAEPSPMLDRVRRRIAARLRDDASIDRVAHDLGVSVRTLQRMLEADGVSFHELSADVRRLRAIAHLTETSDSVERIAERLGYADVSAFRRAFRRWTGLAPASYRAAHRQNGGAPSLGGADADAADGTTPAKAVGGAGS